MMSKSNNLKHNMGIIRTFRILRNNMLRRTTTSRAIITALILIMGTVLTDKIRQNEHHIENSDRSLQMK